MAAPFDKPPSSQELHRRTRNGDLEGVRRRLASESAHDIIGSLGYSGTRRYGETPVYRLDTKTFRIEKLEPEGEAPGWIWEHRAIQPAANKIRVSGGKITTWCDGKEAQVDNDRVFVLDVRRLVWTAEEAG